MNRQFLDGLADTTLPHVSKLPAARRTLGRWACLLLLVVCSLEMTGCCCLHRRPRRLCRQAQLRSLQFYQANQGLQYELSDAQNTANQLAMERDQALQQAQIAEARTQNLLAERDQLHQSISQQFGGLQAPGNPLSGAANRRLQDLASRNPDFEYDATAGICRFNNNLLYDLGSDQIRPEGAAILREFANIMNEAGHRDLEILVVGHTDDTPIVRATTAARHPTNWELSAHRATTVIRSLAGMGIAEARMGGAEYSMHRPTTSNVSDSSRQQNRRVEIFVLAPQETMSAGGQFIQSR